MIVSLQTSDVRIKKLHLESRVFVRNCRAGHYICKISGVMKLKFGVVT